MTAIAGRARIRRVRPKIYVNGKPIAGRAVQQVIWSGISAVLAAALVAGAYFLVTQVEWRAGPVHFGLKSWWDGGMGFVHSASWTLYRHGLRNLWEPALATLFVKSLLARRWQRDDTRVSGVRLATAPLLLFAVATVLVIGGIWVLDFGAPGAWHAAFGNYRVANPVHLPHSLAWLANFLSGWNWQVVLVGVIVGQVVHQLWAPMGNTIQGFFIDREAAKYLRRQAQGREILRAFGSRQIMLDDALAQFAVSGVTLPVWVRYPVAPPVARERFAWAVGSGAPRQHGKLDTRLILAVATVAVIVMIVGLIARYWIANGHSVPYLAP